MDIKDITIKIRIHPRNIDYTNKIIEAYEGIALVSTEDSKNGIVVLRTSPGCYQDLKYILETFPITYEIISVDGI